MSDEPTVEKNEGWDYRDSPDLPAKPDLAKLWPAPGEPLSVGLTEQQVADNFGAPGLDAEQRIEQAKAGREAAQWRAILEAPRAPSSRAMPADANYWGGTAALPAPGDTSTPQRIDVSTADLSGTNYTVKQVVALYQVSERTVMAKLRAGKVPGASKIPGANGELWALPVASVAQLWKVRTETPGVAAAEKPDPAETTELLRQLIATQSQMHAEIVALRSHIEELKQFTHRALPAASNSPGAGHDSDAPAGRRRWGKRKK